MEVAGAVMANRTVLIERCVHCHRAELDWRPIGDDLDSRSYTCSLCFDQLRITELMNGVVIMYARMFPGLPPLFPQELFYYLFPSNYTQWREMNRCNREQRALSLSFLLCGAPWSGNRIYDLHLRIEAHRGFGWMWKGRLYSHSSWDCRTDSFSVLNDFLT